MTRRKAREFKILSKPHQNIRFFCELEIPDGIEQLHLAENSITDFVGLNDSDCLIDIVLDKNPIISFRGFPTLTNLQHLSLRRTPISKLPNFRALAVLCSGDQLKNLNGQEVTSVDRASAKAYLRSFPQLKTQGDLDPIARDLIIRGWIPREPIAFAPSREARTKKLDTKEINGAWNPARDVRADILALVERQEQDPISVQITRTLRYIGYTEIEIGEYLRRYFGAEIRNPPVKKGKISEIDAQLESQEEVIGTLARQLQILRSGNQVLANYQTMIAEAGKRLIENREIVAGYAGEHVTPDVSVADHELLRTAVINFLHADPNSTDADLIDGLDAVIIREEDEEEDEEEVRRDFEQDSFDDE
jgi:hypothetical protein